MTASATILRVLSRQSAEYKEFHNQINFLTGLWPSFRGTVKFPPNPDLVCSYSVP